MRQFQLTGTDRHINPNAYPRPHRGADSCAEVDPHIYLYTHTCSDRDPETNAEAGPDTHRYAYIRPYCRPYSLADPDVDSFPDAHSIADNRPYSDPDSNAEPNPEPNPYSVSISHSTGVGRGHRDHVHILRWSGSEVGIRRVRANH